MGRSGKAERAAISWEGDSRDVLGAWPKPIRGDFGVALNEMQEGRSVALPIRPMPSIAAGVFELKDSDENKWYRMIYLARVEDVIYVLHCFTKNTAKTEKRDLATAEQRWKLVQQSYGRLGQMKAKNSRKGKTPHVTNGSVLDDLGFSPSEALELKVKAEIYYELLEYIRERGYAQLELSMLLGIHQPDVSNLLNGRVSKFSVSKLIKFAGKLNLVAQIKFTRPKIEKARSIRASRTTSKRPANVISG